MNPHIFRIFSLTLALFLAIPALFGTPIPLRLPDYFPNEASFSAYLTAPLETVLPIVSHHNSYRVVLVHWYDSGASDAYIYISKNGSFECLFKLKVGDNITIERAGGFFKIIEHFASINRTTGQMEQASLVDLEFSDNIDSDYPIVPKESR